MKVTSARISQLIFLAIFIALFVTTDYRGKDEISVALNSFFRADPLVTVSYILSAKTFTRLLLPGIIMIAASVLLGRFFCGWICPLGTILDLVTNKIKKTGSLAILKTRFKYYLLFSLLFTGLFNINLAGVLDPIAVLIRALTFFLYPLLGYSVKQGWVGLYSVIGEKRDAVQPAYDFLKSYILPFRETFYPLAFISLLFLLLIIFIERYETRNWCRNLCPLGTLLGLLGRSSLFKRLPSKFCADCGDCRTICPTSFDSDILQKQDCIMCMECSLKCGHNRVKFKAGQTSKEKQEPAWDRRIVLTSLVSGLFISKVFRFKSSLPEENTLRPPGVKNEDEFMKKCVRCGECMKVCLKNALYPSVLQTGLYGIFTPVLIPKLGYCEYNCNLCGQVCPSGAIPNLPLDQKKKSAVGYAVFDKNHCLPYAKRTNCIVCEEHCPVPEKAIRVELSEEKDYRGRRVLLRKPYVVEELCNGCGICENKCPLEGRAGIKVFRKKLSGMQINTTPY